MITSTDIRTFFLSQNLNHGKINIHRATRCRQGANKLFFLFSTTTSCIQNMKVCSVPFQNMSLPQHQEQVVETQLMAMTESAYSKMNTSKVSHKFLAGQIGLRPNQVGFPWQINQIASYLINITVIICIGW